MRDAPPVGESTEAVETALDEIRRLKSVGDMRAALSSAYSLQGRLVPGPYKDPGSLEQMFEATDEALHIHTFITPNTIILDLALPLLSRAGAIAKELDDSVLTGRVVARR